MDPPPPAYKPKLKPRKKKLLLLTKEQVRKTTNKDPFTSRKKKPSRPKGKGRPVDTAEKGRGKKKEGRQQSSVRQEKGDISGNTPQEGHHPEAGKKSKTNEGEL